MRYGTAGDGEHVVRQFTYLESPELGTSSWGFAGETKLVRSRSGQHVCRVVVMTHTR